jgi:hypothetical protein
MKLNLRKTVCYLRGHQWLYGFVRRGWVCGYCGKKEADKALADRGMANRMLETVFFVGTIALTIVIGFALWVLAALEIGSP